VSRFDGLDGTVHQPSLWIDVGVASSDSSGGLSFREPGVHWRTRLRPDPLVSPGPLRILPAPHGPHHSLTGDIRLLEAFRSDVLDNSRDVLVYVPPGYESAADIRYPVLYLHDGQNIFDGATSYVPGQEWRVDETVEALIHAGRIQPLIVVAVNHGVTERAEEFGPTRDAYRQHGGRADLYTSFLVDELKPFVDRTFRTLADARHAALGGSSMGGLVTLHVGLTRPDVFGTLVVMSPSLWWDRRAMLSRVDALPGKLPWRIWLDCGTAEGRDTVRNVRALRQLLLEKGWVGGDDLRYVEIKEAPHTEAAWGDRMESVLKFLAPPNA
jgi:predicted alpha/beta superfamily hydrolase